MGDAGEAATGCAVGPWKPPRVAAAISSMTVTGARGANVAADARAKAPGDDRRSGANPDAPHTSDERTDAPKADGAKRSTPADATDRDTGAAGSTTSLVSAAPAIARDIAGTFCRRRTRKSPLIVGIYD